LSNLAPTVFSDVTTHVLCHGLNVQMHICWITLVGAADISPRSLCPRNLCGPQTLPFDLVSFIVSGYCNLQAGCATHT